MRYKITTNDDATYETVISYLTGNKRGQIKVRLPNRHTLSVEDLTDDAIRKLQDLGARVSEEYQFAIDTARRSVG